MRQEHFNHFTLWFARFALALIFIWFGALKLAGVSPVVGVIGQAMPVIVQYPILYALLALFELAVGFALLIPRLTRAACWLIVAHLILATGSVLISPQAFESGFPALSVVGEFVVKNLALIALALILATQKSATVEL
ncbi:MAG: DUF417 family protein [bacterium]|nr:DUF417 family protein [bacterium]